MKKVLFILAVVIFGCATIAMADSSVDWSTRSNCWDDEQGNCGGCYNYAAVEFQGQSDRKIANLVAVLNGEIQGNIVSQRITPKKGKEMDNAGSQYASGIPVYAPGYYELELKNGNKIQSSGYVEIPELMYSVWDISANNNGNISVTIDITPLFGTEVPTGAAGITIVGGALNKLGVISEGNCGDYLFSFLLSREEMNNLQGSEVDTVLDIAGNYYTSNIYFYSPYVEDYTSVQARATSMAKAKKMKKAKATRVR